MPEGITAECLMNNIMETINDGVSKHKNGSLFEDSASSVTSQFNRLFGREKPIHHILGGGKSADVLLWRDKKISASVLTGATIVWVIFEWLNYNFLTILCFILVMVLIAQFLWKNASVILNRSPSDVPRLVFPEEVFANTGKLIGAEVNRGLGYLQDVACEGNMKQFLVVVAGLWAAAIVGSWCNFLTVLYIGMKIKLMALCTMSWDSFNRITKSWMQEFSAESQPANSGERSLNRSFFVASERSIFSSCNEMLLAIVKALHFLCP